MPEARPCQTLELRNHSSDSQRLSAFLHDFLMQHGQAELFDDLRLAVEEAFINIVSYAHKEAGQHPVLLQLEHTDSQLRITFTDRGTAFDPTGHVSDCMEDNAHECGGMGLHLIRSLTDEQKYQRIDEQNVFTLIRYYT